MIQKPTAGEQKAEKTKSGDGSKNPARPGASRTVNPEDFEVRETPEGFTLCYLERPVLAQTGVEVRHTSRWLLQHIICEFHGWGRVRMSRRITVEPQFLGAYHLVGVQKRYIDQGKGRLAKHSGSYLAGDPLFHGSADPNVWMAQTARLSGVTPCMRDAVAHLNLVIPELSFEAMVGDLGVRELEGGSRPYLKARLDADEVVQDLHQLYVSASPEVRTAITRLREAHGGVLVGPLAVAFGRCTATDYARVVLPSHGLLTAAYRRVRPEEQRTAFLRYRDDAHAVLEFLQVSQA